MEDCHQNPYQNKTVREVADLVWQRVPIPQKTFETICRLGRAVFATEPTVLTLRSPIVVVGDIHGQFYDMRAMIEKNGSLSTTNYLFLGDLVDRGRFSIEVFALLLCYKIMYPNSIHIIRGNHEIQYISVMYGFYNECVQRYGSGEAWNVAMSACDRMPIAAIIDGRFFCVHGGLSQLIPTVDVLHRTDVDPESNAITDLLWSDPAPVTDRQTVWASNSRGCGHVFGVQPTKAFLAANGFQMIIRAHQLMQEGYGIWWDGMLSTVWSAPKYVYRDNNLASTLRIGYNGPTNMEFHVFDAVPADKREIPQTTSRPTSLYN